MPLLLLATTAALLAPPSTCPGQFATAAPSAAQERTMRCMVNYARRQVGAPALRPNAPLARAAAWKAHDLVRCHQFSHTACGRAFTVRIAEAGYRWGTVGENLAMGSGAGGEPRAVMRAWLGSPPHRANVLRAAYRDQGIALVRGTMPGYRHARLWVNEFGVRG
jgi:uncharacterized protein YkwD